GIEPEVKRMSAMRLHRKSDIIERGEVRKQRCHLKGARQPQLTAPIDRQVCDFLTVETDAPVIRRNFSGQLTNQSRFTGAIRTDDGVQLARRKCKRNSISSDHTAETLGQIFDFEQSLSHRAAP